MYLAYLVASGTFSIKAKLIVVDIKLALARCVLADLSSGQISSNLIQSAGVMEIVIGNTMHAA